MIFITTKEERETYYKLKKGGFSMEEIENIIRGEREAEENMNEKTQEGLLYVLVQWNRKEIDANIAMSKIWNMIAADPDGALQRYWNFTEKIRTEMVKKYGEEDD